MSQRPKDDNEHDHKTQASTSQLIGAVTGYQCSEPILHNGGLGQTIKKMCQAAIL
jgi:hypothetical protein